MVRGLVIKSPDYFTSSLARPVKCGSGPVETQRQNILTIDNLLVVDSECESRNRYERI